MKIRTFLGSSDNTVLLKTPSFSPVKPPLEFAVTLTVSVILTTNMMFFFWSRPSDFKSSFKLRKGHFPQISSHLPLKITVQERSNHVLGLRGQLKGHRKAPTGRSFYHHKPENAVLKRVASLCTHKISYRKKGSIKGAEVWSPKISTTKTTNNEYWTLEFRLPDVLRDGVPVFNFHFEHHITKELFLKIKKD